MPVVTIEEEKGALAAAGLKRVTMVLWRANLGAGVARFFMQKREREVGRVLINSEVLLFETNLRARFAPGKAITPTRLCAAPTRL